MTRIEFAARILGHLRRDRQAPVSRYAYVLACASAGPDGASLKDIATALGDETYRDIAGAITKIEQASLIRRIPGAKPLRWTPTQQGLRLIEPLINPKPQTAIP
jgi:hypothetical protein